MPKGMGEVCVMHGTSLLKVTCSRDGATVYDRNKEDMKDYLCMPADDAKDLISSCEQSKQEALRCPQL